MSLVRKSRTPVLSARISCSKPVTILLLIIPSPSTHEDTTTREENEQHKNAKEIHKHTGHRLKLIKLLSPVMKT